jgi:opacity protein-like surface antigen
MKKLLTSVIYLMVLLISHATYSQAQSGDIELGFGIGPSFASVSDFDGQANAGTLTSFNMAASGEYYFSDRWGIKMKLIYDNKGWSDGFIEDETGFFDTDYKLGYLTIPVMANWHFSKNRNWYLNFGGYAGFLLSAKDTTLDTDLKESFSSTDFGLTAGIGYGFRLNDQMRLFLEYEEQFGFSDIFEFNPGDAISNRRSSFNLGLLYQLK